MELTFIGVVCIFITLILLFQKQSVNFIYASLFFCGFSGSSVLIIGGLSIQPSFYFIIIYFIISFFSLSKFKKIPIIFVIFLGYCIFTLVMPMVLYSKNISIMMQNGSYGALKFGLSNISQLIYLFIDYIFLFVLFKYREDKNINYKFVKWFKYGFYAVCLICIYQIFAFKLNLPFDIIFRQNPDGNVQGTRLYGPTIEASMLCYYLLPSMAFVFIKRKSIYDYLFVLVSIIVGFLTYSSTFFVGLIILIALIAIYAIFDQTRFNIVFNKKRIVLIISFGILLFAGMIYIIGSGLLSYSVDEFLLKINQKSQSGIERAEAFKNMFRVGTKYPLGVGFGSSRSKDLFSTWICNIGFVGVGLFFICLLYTVYVSYKNKNIFLSLPIILCCILMFMSVPEPYNLFIWFLLYYSFVPEKEIIKKKYNERSEFVCLQQNTL